MDTLRSSQSKLWEIFTRISILTFLTFVLSFLTAAYSNQWLNPNRPLYILGIILFGLVHPLYYRLALTRDDSQMKRGRYIAMVSSGMIAFVIGVDVSTIITQQQLWLLSSVAAGTAVLAGIIYDYTFIQQNWLNDLLWKKLNAYEFFEGIGWHASILFVALFISMFFSIADLSPLVVTILTMVIWIVLRICCSIFDLTNGTTNPVMFYFSTAVLSAAVGYILIPGWWTMGIAAVLAILLRVTERKRIYDYTDTVDTIRDKLTAQM